MYKVFRFFEIDINYLRVNKLSLIKFKNIITTNIIIILNIILHIIINKNKQYRPVLYNSSKVYYDTIFATKTFLSAEYDFYTETNSLKIFSNKPVIVDVGANIGQFLFAVKSSLPAAEVYSFEPDEEIYSILKKNVKHMNKVHAFNLALGKNRGIFDFYVSKEFSEWSTLINNKSDKYIKTKVKMDTGDNVFKNIKFIDLIKIDVEGAEEQVLKGMGKTLTKAKFLLIEISLLRNAHDPGSSSIFRFLISKGFHMHTIGRVFSDGVGKKQQAVDILFKNTKID